MPNIKSFKTHEQYLQWYRDYRAKYAKEFRKYNRKYNKAWRKKYGYDAEQRAKKKFPRKERARVILRYAIKKGLMVRGKCQVCGKKNGQGHHENYNKPLEVIWLCPLHHRQYEDGKLDKSTIPKRS